VDKSEGREKTLMYVALGLAWQLGYTIVIPLLIFALGGRYLDKKFDSSPVLFLIGLVVSVAVTSVWLVVRMSVFSKEIAQHSKAKDSKKVDSGSSPE
tara:strand:+ start:545 stop:835 length:291 start_codon:yes stop_codon:yes gene_type:complete